MKHSNVRKLFEIPDPELKQIPTQSYTFTISENYINVQNDFKEAVKESQSPEITFVLFIYSLCDSASASVKT